MDKKLERSNKDKILRKVANKLKPFGFKRTKPTFFVKENGPMVEFIHIHKYTFGPTFRVHICLREINDPRDFIALLGITSEQYSRPNSPNNKKYNFSYHKTDESIDRCVQNIESFVSDVAVPWFMKWQNLELLSNSNESPLPYEDRVALKEYISGNGNVDFIEQTRELLKIT